MRLTRNTADAQDLVQYAIVRALRFHEKFQEGTYLKAWLLTILRNTFINDYRKKARRPTMVEWTGAEFVPNMKADPDMGYYPEELKSENVLELLNDDIRDAVESLPEGDRDTVIMADLKNMSYKEIAAEMDRPLGTVMSRLSASEEAPVQERGQPRERHFLMSFDREKMWQAYLDDELTVGETTEFGATLSSEVRDHLAGEKQFEAGLAEVLSRDADCPDEMWERIQAQARAANAPENVVPLRRWYWATGSMAAAASVAFFIAFWVPSILPLPDDLSRSAMVVSAATVDELAALSETAPSLEAVQQYIESHGIDLILIRAGDLGMSAIHFDIDILGVCEEMIDGRNLVSLLFGCCREPVKVVIAMRGSEETRMLGEAIGEASSEVQSTRAVGGDRYLAAVVGGHKAVGLLDLFGDELHTGTPAH